MSKLKFGQYFDADDWGFEAWFEFGQDFEAEFR